jgi:uncharacterized protein YecE (DUF72 family)
LYQYRYSDEDLKMLKDRVQSLSPERRVYCLFNNITMKEDARRFVALTQGAVASADP